MLESQFQAEFIKELRATIPGCIVLKNDANYIQGFPDILVLYGERWAALECKRSSSARVRPNQRYYVNLLNDMSYSAFVSPENKEDVLHAVQQALKSQGNAFVPGS